VGLLQGGDTAGALRAAQSILLAEPRNFDALHIAALASFHRRELDPALRYIEKALALRRDMADAFNTHGMILRGLGRVAEAAEPFAQAARLNPRSREAHYNLGNCLQDLGRLPEALQQYEAALKIDPAMLMAWNNRGLALRRLGQQEQAAASFSEAIRRAGDFAPAYYNRGDALAALGRRDDALADYDRAIALKPDFAEAHCNRANVLLEQGQAREALGGYDRAIALAPGFHQAWMSRGIALASLLRLADAEESMRRAIVLAPGLAEAHYNLGKVLKEQGRLEEAVSAYDEAIRLAPAHAEALGNRGTALKELGRLDEALASLDRALALKPGFAEAHSNRGNVLTELLRLDEALASQDRAVALMPDVADIHCNRGNTLQELNRLDEAVASFDRAIALKADHAEAYSNRGNALRELGRLDAAIASFDRAIALTPDKAGMRYNKAMAALQAHDFRTGFDLYRDRWNSPDFEGHAPKTDVPGWDGGPPRGPLLLWAEQGIGDELFYASLLSLLDFDRMQVTLAADRRLHPLFRRSFPGLTLVGRQDTSGDFAAQAAIGDLGHLLGVDAAMISRRRHPYLLAGAERMAALCAGNAVLNTGRVCGVSWRSGNRRMGGARSIGLGDLAPLLADSGFSAVNLQYGDVGPDVRAAREEHALDIQVLKGLDVFNDLDGLAAAIALCDVVLTIDNVTAHLAGALGIPAIVLVPTGKGRYWYWGGERQSLWYPSLSLVYQEQIGDWAPSLAEAGRLLRNLDAAPRDR
jgi:tetratricopeptide (TPR) repeat protein